MIHHSVDAKGKFMPQICKRIPDFNFMDEKGMTWFCRKKLKNNMEFHVIEKN